MGWPAKVRSMCRTASSAATFEYPLCADKAVEIGLQMLKDKGFKPDKQYILESRAITRK